MFLILSNKKSIIYISSFKFILCKIRSQSIIPSSRSLFKTIQCFLQFVGSVWIHKSFRLLHIHFFLQHPIQKCTIYIHLIEFEVQVKCNGQENSDRLKSSYRCKSLIKFYSFYLSVPLSNKSLITVPCSSDLFLKIHLVPITLTPCGLGTNSHTSFRMNWWSSSCFDTTCLFCLDPYKLDLFNLIN